MFIFFVNPIHHFSPENAHQYCKKQHDHGKKKIHYLKVRIAKKIAGAIE